MMTFTAYDLKQIDNAMGYVKSNNQKLIEDFVDSGHDCVKVEGWTNKTAGSATNSINATIKTMHKGGIKAISRRGEVFLVKTSAMKE